MGVYAIDIDVVWSSTNKVNMNTHRSLNSYDLVPTYATYTKLLTKKKKAKQNMTDKNNFIFSI